MSVRCKADGTRKANWPLISNAEKDDLIRRCKANEPMEARPALKITLGWQFDRILVTVPPKLAWMWIVVVLIWLAVVVWQRRSMDWGVAMGFGQLLAACVGLLLLHLRV